MKIRIFLPLLLLVALLLTGCQSASPTTQPGETVATQAPAQENPAAGSEPTAYPAPGQSDAAVADASASIYPGSKDGDTISWDQAKSLVLNGEVTKVIQSQNLQVKLVLKDSRTLVTTEPELDDIINLLKNCGDFCKDIAVEAE